jgi:putative transposase
VPLHIIQRGNNRGRCFARERDYRLYLALLEELCPKFECRVHAYVLMTNHVHLLVTPEIATSASNVMKHLGQRYVQYVNRTEGRSGSLWEGRFRSSIVDTDAYLLRCHRYIECNPVRAGMVVDPADYPWSSYRANALGEPNALITPHARYVGLAETTVERRARYLRLFEGEMTNAELARIRDAANGGFALGSPRFIEEMGRLLGRRAGRSREPVPARGTSGLSPVQAAISVLSADSGSPSFQGRSTG